MHIRNKNNCLAVKLGFKKNIFRLLFICKIIFICTLLSVMLTLRKVIIKHVNR